MFNAVKQLKVAELANRVEALKAEKHAIEADVRNLQDRLREMEWQQRMGMHGYSGKKKFSTWERLVSKRQAYRAYNAKLAELAALPEKIAALTSEIETAKSQVADKLAASGILTEISTAESAMMRAECAESLAELDITPTAAVTLLEENGIPPLLDESDRVIFERPRNYQSKADLMAVHKMDVMPTGNQLTTLAEAGVERTEDITLDGKTYQYSFPMNRNTVHVSLNDEVSSHWYGNWDACQYTVLQPLAEIPSSQIAGAVPNDTFTRGSIDLTANAWILCPADEVEKVKHQNPTVHVLGYQGESSMGLAAPFLSQLGYRAEEVGQWGWNDQESQQQFFDLMNRENVRVVQHCDSTDTEDEDLRIAVAKTISLCKMLRDQNLVQTPDDFQRLQPQIEQQTHAFTDLSKVFGSSNVQDPKNIDATAIIANGRQVEYLAHKMAQAGMPLSSADLQRLQLKKDKQLDTELPAAQQISAKDLLKQVMVNSLINSRCVETEREV